MSPCTCDAAMAVTSFPRVSGDEPEQKANMVKQVTFSPRERG